MNNKKTKNGFYLGIFSLTILIILGINSKSSIFFDSYNWLIEGVLRLISLGLASLGMIISLIKNENFKFYYQWNNLTIFFNYDYYRLIFDV